MCSITKVTESYKRFLETKHPQHFQPYCRRLKHQPESAKAEAITYSFFRSRCDDVQVEEDLSKGGVDFRCKSKDGTGFVSEVTCLEVESVAGQSKLKNEFPEEGFGGSFAMVTPKLLSKAVSKAKQMSGYCCPRVLVMTSEHWMSSVLLGQAGAEFLLTDELEILEPIDRPGNTGKLENVDSVTDLENAVFFRMKNGKLESCRRSISAILLFSVSPDKTFSEVVGLLHPDPAYKFPICTLPSIPFLRLKEWPPKNNRIETEWSIHEPKPDKFYHIGFDNPSFLVEEDQPHTDEDPMDCKLSRVEIQQHAEFVQRVAKRLQEIAERLLPNIRDLQETTGHLLSDIKDVQEVIERVREDAEDLWKIGERLIGFDETLHPEAGFAPYWSHVADSQAFADGLETDVQHLQIFTNRLQVFTNGLETEIQGLQKCVQNLQKNVKSLEAVEEDLRHIQQWGTSE